ncbi:MAG: hypothetical protein KatS3mg008_1377 [Acidimicrobiales bacterium]|nr:MAG: hypothetical protein KatS3mg008_1377 [Acidimicrobiales bacterium]
MSEPAALEMTDADESFRRLVERLSRQSVEKYYTAYEDIPWDEPGFEIDPADPRWEAVVDDGLRATEWYSNLPQQERSRLGLCLAANFMKIGLQFENVLQRGLLEFSFRLPNGDPKFRYAYHETIEEAQHTLMFQEFVNRSGFDVPGLPRRFTPAVRFVVLLARWFPELFFVFVLGGEDPIDHRQRAALRARAALPPILERIIRIHVTEEARHLSFARNYLRLHVPKAGPVRRAILSVGAPVVLGVMAQLMMRPSPFVVREFAIPRSALRKAYDDNPAHRAGVAESLSKVRRLCGELGLVNPVSKMIWRVLGIWSD